MVMDKKTYLIIMKVITAVLFFVAVVFIIIDTFYFSWTVKYLYTVFIALAAVLLIVSSVIELVRMEKYVKEIEGDEQAEELTEEKKDEKAEQ